MKMYEEELLTRQAEEQQTGVNAAPDISVFLPCL
jgi:hypothetical protein